VNILHDVFIGFNSINTCSHCTQVSLGCLVSDPSKPGQDYHPIKLTQRRSTHDMLKCIFWCRQTHRYRHFLCSSDVGAISITSEGSEVNTCCRPISSNQPNLIPHHSLIPLCLSPLSQTVCQSMSLLLSAIPIHRIHPYMLDSYSKCCAWTDGICSLISQWHNWLRNHI